MLASMRSRGPRGRGWRRPRSCRPGDGGLARPGGVGLDHRAGRGTTRWRDPGWPTGRGGDLQPRGAGRLVGRAAVRRRGVARRMSGGREGVQRRPGRVRPGRGEDEAGDRPRRRRAELLARHEPRAGEAGRRQDRLGPSPSGSPPAGSGSGRSPPVQTDRPRRGRRARRRPSTSTPADGLRWADVAIPEGMEVVDQRLEAHGFAPADGIVLEGRSSTWRPASRSPAGSGWSSPSSGRGAVPPLDVVEAGADAQGRWVLKKARPAWNRVVIEAEGYVPRVVGYGQLDDQPGWHSFDRGLARPPPSRAGSSTRRAGPWPGWRSGSTTCLRRGDGRYESTGRSRPDRRRRPIPGRSGSRPAGPRSGFASRATLARAWAFPSRPRPRASNWR